MFHFFFVTSTRNNEYGYNKCLSQSLCQFHTHKVRCVICLPVSLSVTNVACLSWAVAVRSVYLPADLSKYKPARQPGYYSRPRAAWPACLSVSLLNPPPPALPCLAGATRYVVCINLRKTEFESIYIMFYHSTKKLLMGMKCVKEHNFMQ